MVTLLTVDHIHLSCKAVVGLYVLVKAFILHQVYWQAWLNLHKAPFHACGILMLFASMFGFCVAGTISRGTQAQ